MVVVACSLWCVGRCALFVVCFACCVLCDLIHLLFGMCCSLCVVCYLFWGVFVVRLRCLLLVVRCCCVRFVGCRVLFVVRIVLPRVH